MVLLAQKCSGMDQHRRGLRNPPAGKGQQWLGGGEGLPWRQKPSPKGCLLWGPGLAWTSPLRQSWAPLKPQAGLPGLITHKLVASCSLAPPGPAELQGWATAGGHKDRQMAGWGLGGWGCWGSCHEEGTVLSRATKAEISNCQGKQAGLVARSQRAMW